MELQRYVDGLEASTGILPKRLFIDHLGLMPGAQDTEGLKAITSGLKGWAKRDELAVTCLQQASRAGSEASRNDGHMPLTLSSGMYGGEADADWIFGLYRPEKAPEFRKQSHEFKKHDDYLRMTMERDKVRNLTRLQVVKNRITGHTKDRGVDLNYDPHSRRLTEYGGSE
jgi:replicative DNA helicase